MNRWHSKFAMRKQNNCVDVINSNKYISVSLNDFYAARNEYLIDSIKLLILQWNMIPVVEEKNENSHLYRCVYRLPTFGWNNS